MPLFFKEYSLAEVTYLLIRFNKTQAILENKKNDKNDVKNQKTHVEKYHWSRLIRIKISDTCYINPSLIM